MLLHYKGNYDKRTKMWLLITVRLYGKQRSSDQKACQKDITSQKDITNTNQHQMQTLKVQSIGIFTSLNFLYYLMYAFPELLFLSFDPSGTYLTRN